MGACRCLRAAATANITATMPNFAGTWKMRSSENFDELLKALGKVVLRGMPGLLEAAARRPSPREGGLGRFRQEEVNGVMNLCLLCGPPTPKSGSQRRAGSGPRGFN